MPPGLEGSSAPSLSCRTRGAARQCPHDGHVIPTQWCAGHPGGNRGHTPKTKVCLEGGARTPRLCCGAGPTPAPDPSPASSTTQGPLNKGSLASGIRSQGHAKDKAWSSRSETPPAPGSDPPSQTPSGTQESETMVQMPTRGASLPPGAPQASAPPPPTQMGEGSSPASTKAFMGDIRGSETDLDSQGHAEAAGSVQGAEQVPHSPGGASLLPTTPLPVVGPPGPSPGRSVTLQKLLLRTPLHPSKPAGGKSGKNPSPFWSCRGASNDRPVSLSHLGQEAGVGTGHVRVSRP